MAYRSSLNLPPRHCIRWCLTQLPKLGLCLQVAGTLQCPCASRNKRSSSTRSPQLILDADLRSTPMDSSRTLRASASLPLAKLRRCSWSHLCSLVSPLGTRVWLLDFTKAVSSSNRSFHRSSIPRRSGLGVLGSQHTPSLSSLTSCSGDMVPSRRRLRWYTTHLLRSTNGSRGGTDTCPCSRSNAASSVYFSFQRTLCDRTVGAGSFAPSPPADATQRTGARATRGERVGAPVFARAVLRSAPTGRVPIIACHACANMTPGMFSFTPTPTHRVGRETCDPAGAPRYPP